MYFNVASVAASRSEFAFEGSNMRIFSLIPLRRSVSLNVLILGAVLSVPTSLISGPGRAAVMEYGDENLLNAGTYPSDPKAGAMLQGLAPDAVTDAASTFVHTFPFSPDAGDFPGTDQIYVGSNQTAVHDGYAESPQRLAGPQVITMNYSSLVPAGDSVQTLTLGIAADEFQFPAFGNPFSATLNGFAATALTTKLNSLNENGPATHFFTIGVDPSILNASNQLVLSINSGGDGGDGWAIDYLTIGVTASPVPEPSTILLSGLGAAAALAMRFRRRRHGPRQLSAAVVSPV
jgi:hypothetical protein